MLTSEAVTKPLKRYRTSAILCQTPRNPTSFTRQLDGTLMALRRRSAPPACTPCGTVQRAHALLVPLHTLLVHTIATPVHTPLATWATAERTQPPTSFSACKAMHAEDAVEARPAGSIKAQRRLQRRCGLAFRSFAAHAARCPPPPTRLESNNRNEPAHAVATVERNSVRAPPTPTPVSSLSPPTEMSTGGRISEQVAIALCTGSSRNVLNGSRSTLPASYAVYACSHSATSRPVSHPARLRAGHTFKHAPWTQRHLSTAPCGVSEQISAAHTPAGPTPAVT